MIATAAETPASPGPRVARALAKERAGASALILNHAGNVTELIDFVGRARDAGSVAPAVACVPVIVSARSAVRLGRLPGLRLPDHLLSSIANAPNPRREGIARAAAYAAELLETGRFAGINLSGPAGVSSAEERLAITEELLDTLHQT